MSVSTLADGGESKLSEGLPAPELSALPGEPGRTRGETRFPSLEDTQRAAARTERRFPSLEEVQRAAARQEQRFPSLEDIQSASVPPELQMAADRKASIINDTPARFRVDVNPKADAGAPFFESTGVGNHAVTLFFPLTEMKAAHHGVDPDLVRAIMFMETSHGYYDVLLGVIDKNKSLLPMNVHTEYWKELGYSRQALHNPEVNIEVGTLLLKRISERMPGASIEQVASVYNFMGAERVTDYGARVGAIYREKPWLRSPKR